MMGNMWLGKHYALALLAPVVVFYEALIANTRCGSGAYRGSVVLLLLALASWSLAVPRCRNRWSRPPAIFVATLLTGLGIHELLPLQAGLPVITWAIPGALLAAVLSNSVAAAARALWAVRCPNG